MIFLEDVTPSYVLGLHYNCIALIPKQHDEEGNYIPYPQPALEEMLCMDFIAFKALQIAVNTLREMEEQGKMEFMSYAHHFVLTPHTVECDGEEKTVYTYEYYVDDELMLSVEQEDFEALRAYLNDDTNIRNAEKALQDLMINAPAWKDPEMVEDNPEDVFDLIDIMLYVDSGNGDRIAYLRQ